MTLSLRILLESVWALDDGALSGGGVELIVAWAANSLTSSLDLLEVGLAVLYAVVVDLGVTLRTFLEDAFTVLDFILFIFASLSDAFFGLGHFVVLWTTLPDTFLSIYLEVFWAGSLDALLVLKNVSSMTVGLLASLGDLIETVVLWTGNQFALTLGVSLLVLGALSAPAVFVDQNVSFWARFSDAGLSNLLEARLALEVSALSVDEELLRVTDDSVALFVLEDVLLRAGDSDAFIVLKLEVLWTLLDHTLSVLVFLGSLWTVLDAELTLLYVSTLAVLFLGAMPVLEFESRRASLQDTLVQLGVEVVVLVAGSLDAVIGVVESHESSWALLQDTLSVLQFESFFTLGEHALLVDKLVVLRTLLNSITVISSLLVSLWTSGDSALSILVDTILGTLNLVAPVSSLFKSWFAFLSEAIFSNELIVLRAGLSDTESLRVSGEVLWTVLQTDSSSQSIAFWAPFSGTSSISDNFSARTLSQHALSFLGHGVTFVSAALLNALALGVLLGSSWTSLFHTFISIFGPSFWTLFEMALTVLLEGVSALALESNTLVSFLLLILWTVFDLDALSLLIWLRTVFTDFSFTVLGFFVLFISLVALDRLTDLSVQFITLVTGQDSAASLVLLSTLRASVSDTLLSDKLEVLGAAISDALTLDKLEVLLAVGVTGVVMQSPSSWAGCSLAGTVLLESVESWAGGSDTRGSLEGVVSWAGELHAALLSLNGASWASFVVAFTVLQNHIGFRTDSSDALSVEQFPLRSAGGSNALVLFVHGEVSRAGGLLEAVFSSEDEFIRAGGSSALTLLQGKVLRTRGLSALLVLVSESFIADDLVALISLQSVTIGAGGSNTGSLVIDGGQNVTGLALRDDAFSVLFFEIFWALGVLVFVALLMLHNHTLWTGGSDAFISEWLEVFWTGLTDALLVLEDKAFFAISVTSSESEGESLVTSLSLAFTVNNLVVLILASLQDALLVGGQGETLLAGNSDTGLSFLLVSGSAFDLVALLILLVHGVSGWATLSDTLSVDQVEVLGTELSDALAILGLESSWAFLDAGILLEFPSLLTGLHVALVTVLSESLWTSSEGTLSVNEFVSLVTNNLVAFSVLQLVSGGASDSDAMLSLLLVVLWAFFEVALSLDFLVSLLTWRNTVTRLSEVETLITGDSLTLGTEFLIVWWAGGNFAFIILVQFGVWSAGLHNLEALLVLQEVTWLAFNKLAFSSGLIEFLVFSTFDTLVLVSGPSGSTGFSDTSSLGEGVARLALHDDTLLGNRIPLGSSSTEDLVTSVSSELVSLGTGDSSAFVDSLDLNQLEVLSTGVSDTVTVDHLVSLGAFLNTLITVLLEPFWARGVNASVELHGVLLVVSTFDLGAGSGLLVEVVSFWAANSDALMVLLHEVLLALELVALSVLVVEGPSVWAAHSLTGSLRELMVGWALDALSLE